MYDASMESLKAVEYIGEFAEMRLPVLRSSWINLIPVQ